MTNLHPEAFGKVIAAADNVRTFRTFTIVRNDNHVDRRCSSAHCQATVAVMKLTSWNNRGWCHQHWPDYIEDEVAALTPPRRQQPRHPPPTLKLLVSGIPYVGHIIQGGTGPEMMTFDDGGEIIPRNDV